MRFYILISNICITTQYSHDECVDDAYNVSRLHLKKDLAFYLKCSAEVSIMSLFFRSAPNIRFGMTEYCLVFCLNVVQRDK